MMAKEWIRVALAVLCAGCLIVAAELGAFLPSIFAFVAGALFAILVITVDQYPPDPEKPKDDDDSVDMDQ